LIFVETLGLATIVCVSRTDFPFVPVLLVFIWLYLIDIPFVFFRSVTRVLWQQEYQNI
jgi:hypothetical protein